ncbi:hypothetical protein SUGI_1519430 [Cryptomeria japonica]|uniref:Uncharacterized protein n=1 Tax=Cryptomeria japonica TaxID=3369 RepID=A0AAD3RRW2_CRYJA|nr:hypothetical protein SUGI_1519430 [Cryptomeria japonica]
MEGNGKHENVNEGKGKHGGVKERNREYGDIKEAVFCSLNSSQKETMGGTIGTCSRAEVEAAVNLGYPFFLKL